MGLTESREHWSEHGIGEVWRSGDAQPPTRMPPCFVEFIRRVLEQLERPPDTLPVLRGRRALQRVGDAPGRHDCRAVVPDIGAGRAKAPTGTGVKPPVSAIPEQFAVVFPAIP